MFDLSFLFLDFMTKPVWMWALFLGIVLSLMAFDLGLLHKNQREIGVTESLKLSAFYASMGLLFGGWVWYEMGSQAGMLYLTGFIVEQSLAMDNIFVMAMILGFFKIPRAYQHRVLFWGILGVIFLRAIMIGLGAALVSQFAWILYLFAMFLVLTGFKLLVLSEATQHWMGRARTAWPILISLWLAMCGAFAYAAHTGMNHAGDPLWVQMVIYAGLALTAFLGVKITQITQEEDTDLSDNIVLKWMRRHMPITNELHGQAFWVRLPHPKTGRVVLFCTPLFVALVLIELADVVFAVDSVPAIFTLTTDPYIVYTSNIFAILGLRALYFALAALMERFAYLKYALSMVLIFIGSKIFITELLGWEKFPPAASLGITLGLLATGFIYSWVKTGRSADSARG